MKFAFERVNSTKMPAQAADVPRLAFRRERIPECWCGKAAALSNFKYVRERQFDCSKSMRHVVAITFDRRTFFEMWKSTAGTRLGNA